MDGFVSLKHPDKCFIGGEWVAPSRNTEIQIISAHTEAPFLSFAEAQTGDVHRAVAAARRAFDFGPWPRMSPQERGDFLRKMGEGVARRRDDFAQIHVHQSGILFSLAQWRASPQLWNYYADLASTFPFEEPHDAEDASLTAILMREPVGVVGAIIAWNGPIDQITVKCAPALLAGCTVVLKPSPEAPGEAYLMAEIAEEIGLPAGVFNVVVANRDASEALVLHPDVDKISFTGSTATGKKIATICAQRVARCTLELGGKSPAIILDDYDLDQAADSITAATTFLSGQVCAALTRVVVSRDRHDELVECFKSRFENIRVGDPFEESSQMGPLAMDRQLARVLNYIEQGEREGARLVTGGRRPAHLNKGYYVEPTVFANVRNDMRIAQEEIFGPVLSIIPVADEDAAIRVSNESNFGLNASIFTKDRQKALGMSRRLRSGTVGHNGLRGDFTVAFGGFKQSGLGREGGVEGLMPYLETKTILLEAETH